VSLPVLDDVTVVIEDLDFDLPCFRSDDHAAEVLLTCRLCGVYGYYCVKHARLIRADAEAKLMVAGAIQCARCEGRAFSFDELVEEVGI
jgi:hypothetical protein